VPRYGPPIPPATKTIDVPGLNGMYLAGEDGYIYSKLNGRHGFSSKPRRLSGTKNKNGYLYVSVCAGEERTSVKQVHRLVCLAFHGAPPSGRMDVRHIDGTRDNNRPENLCWGTRSDNIRDAIRHHGMNRAGGVITPEIAVAIRLLDGKIPNTILSEWLGVSGSTVCSIKNNHHWRWLTDRVMQAAQDDRLTVSP